MIFSDFLTNLYQWAVDLHGAVDLLRAVDLQSSLVPYPPRIWPCMCSDSAGNHRHPLSLHVTCVLTFPPYMPGDNLTIIIKILEIFLQKLLSTKYLPAKIHRFVWYMRPRYSFHFSKKNLKWFTGGLKKSKPN